MWRSPLNLCSLSFLPLVTWFMSFPVQIGEWKEYFPRLNRFRQSIEMRWMLIRLGVSSKLKWNSAITLKNSTAQLKRGKINWNVLRVTNIFFFKETGTNNSWIVCLSQIPIGKKHCISITQPWNHRRRRPVCLPFSASMSFIGNYELAQNA